MLEDSLADASRRSLIDSPAMPLPRLHAAASRNSEPL